MTNSFLTNFGAEAAEKEGFAALGFDPKAFLIQLVTFLLVFYILKRFVFGRVVDMLEKRRVTIEEGVKLSAEAKAEAQKLQAEVAQAHKDARAEAQKLLAITKDEASGILKTVEVEANKRAEKILLDARKKIVDETAAARRALEGETVELVIAATEAVSKEKLDATKDAALIKDALKDAQADTRRGQK